MKENEKLPAEFVEKHPDIKIGTVIACYGISYPQMHGISYPQMLLKVKGVKDSQEIYGKEVCVYAGEYALECEKFTVADNSIDYYPIFFLPGKRLLQSTGGFNYVVMETKEWDKALKRFQMARVGLSAQIAAAIEIYRTTHK